MEGVAYNMRALLELTRDAGVPVESLRLIGGGVRNPTWRQIIADVFEMPVEILTTDEGPAFGAALLAAVGARAHPSVQKAASACVGVGQVVQPRANASEVHRERLAQFLRSIRDGRQS